MLTALTGIAAIESSPPTLREGLSGGLAVLIDDVIALLVHDSAAVRDAALGIVSVVLRSDTNVECARVGTVRGLCHGLITCLYMAVLRANNSSLAMGSSSVGGSGGGADVDATVRRVMSAARRLLVRADAAAAMAGMVVEGLIEVGDDASSGLGGAGASFKLALCSSLFPFLALQSSCHIYTH